MNEEPKEGEQGLDSPVAPLPTAPDPPSYSVGGSATTPSADSPQRLDHHPSSVAYPDAVEAPKRKLDGGFFALGLVTPLLAGALTTLPINIFGEGAPPLAWLGSVLPIGVFVAQLIAWLVGRVNGNNRLRSWGLGGVASVAMMALAGLLLFGACMLTLGASGL